MNDEILRSRLSGVRAQASSIGLFLAICLAIGLGAGLVMFLRPDVSPFGSTTFGPTIAAIGTDAGL